MSPFGIFALCQYSTAMHWILVHVQHAVMVEHLEHPALHTYRPTSTTIHSLVHHDIVHSFNPTVRTSKKSSYDGNHPSSIMAFIHTFTHPYIHPYIHRYYTTKHSVAQPHTMPHIINHRHPPDPQNTPSSDNYPQVSQ